MTARLVRISVVLAVFALATTGLAHAGLVNNGGFETGDFSGWTVSGDTTFVGVCDVSTCPSGYAPFEGNFAAYFGPVGDTATISQEIPTTPGQEYTLTFYLALPFGGTPNFFSATFGSTVFNLTNFSSTFDWQQFQISSTATGTETLLSFTFRNDPSYWFLDNVSVTPSGGTTPEPGTLLLFGSGLAGIAGVVRRKLGR